MTQGIQSGLKHISFKAIKNWPKMAEWTEISAREWRSTLPFSANFWPNGLFGQMSYSAKYIFRPNGFRPNEFRPIEVGSQFSFDFW
jgi:hypothetical protein